MYNTDFKNRLVADLDAMKAAGLFKQERYLHTPQFSEVGLRDGSRVINMCANNYLGLANNPVLEETAREAIKRWGFGMASVRFICGTQTLHRELEERLSAFLGTEDTILFGSCFDANGGLFEALLGKEDAIVSDSLNHASIIDGVRLCKAARYRYNNNDMADLEAKLQEAKANGARTILISTDGVFSMDGNIADMPGLVALKKEFGAFLMVDEAHALGVLGKTGKGTDEHFGLQPGDIDITMGTLSKTCCTCGGYIAGSAELIELLKFTSPGFVYSVGMSPVLAAASAKAIEIMLREPERVQKLHRLIVDRRIIAVNDLAQEPEIGQPLEEVALADNLVLAPLLEVALGDAVEGGQQVVDVLDDVVIALPLVVAERAVCQRGQVTLGIVNRVAGGDATGAQHGPGLEGTARGGEQVIDTRGWQVGVAAVQGQFRHVGRGDGPLEVQLVHGVEVQHVHHLAADEAYHYQQDE